MAKSYRCLLPVDNICPALIGSQENNCLGGGVRESSARHRSGAFFGFFPLSSGQRCPDGGVFKGEPRRCAVGLGLLGCLWGQAPGSRERGCGALGTGGPRERCAGSLSLTVSDGSW